MHRQRSLIRPSSEQLQSLSCQPQCNMRNSQAPKNAFWDSTAHFWCFAVISVIWSMMLQLCTLNLPGIAWLQGHVNSKVRREKAPDGGAHRPLGFPAVLSHHNKNGSCKKPCYKSAMSTVVCPAYVGQSVPLASEYHIKDYDWHEHAQQIAPLVEAQWAAAPAGVRQAAQLSSSGEPLSAVAALLQFLQGAKDAGSISKTVGSSSGGSGSSSSSNGSGGSSSSQAAEATELRTPAVALSNSNGCSIEHTSPPPPAAAAAAACQPASENEWEIFYQQHPSARFYKERRYLLLEFPCLAAGSELHHVVEIGAGCGSSILPVLRAQPQAQATVCDVSSTCLQQLSEAMQLLGLGPERCRSFVADGTDPGLAQQLQGCAADVALIMFTLSAVMPEGMLQMMRNAAASLRRGGLLCIRDHALYDMVQLRIPPEQCIGRNLYRRGDETLAYFYTCEELSGLAVAAGLEVVECEYVCVINRNRKSGQELRRAFVHGVFRRP